MGDYKTEHAASRVRLTGSGMGDLRRYVKKEHPLLGIFTGAHNDPMPWWIFVVQGMALAGMALLINATSQGGCLPCYKPLDDCPACVLGRTDARLAARDQCSWCPAVGMCVQTNVDGYWRYSKMALEMATGSEVSGSTLNSFCGNEPIESRYEDPFPAPSEGNVNGRWECEDDCGGTVTAEGDEPAPTTDRQDCDEEGNCVPCTLDCRLLPSFPSSYGSSDEQLYAYCGAAENHTDVITFTSLGATRVIERPRYLESGLPEPTGKTAPGFEMPLPSELCREDNRPSLAFILAVIPLILNAVQLLLRFLFGYNVETADDVSSRRIGCTAFSAFLLIVFVASGATIAGSSDDSAEILIGWVMSVGVSIVSWFVLALPLFFYRHWREGRPASVEESK
eukprot:PLAT1174.2.p1 GENE.PLAT1174.2~~PLAT1174.2.p1  ORF type:complete len:402 (+),score=96.18 PLAT1174.2:26-1207(+)